MNGPMALSSKSLKRITCDSWRGSCVLPAVSKIIAKVILERIRATLISTVDADQAGFRAGSSCTDHINSLRIIIEQCKEFRSALHMIFFDIVNRDCIWRALRSRGIPEKNHSYYKSYILWCLVWRAA